ncbi:MAG: twin-arginine translocation signal domain-containing protein [Chthoniobacterales bacterium]
MPWRRNAAPPFHRDSAESADERCKAERRSRRHFLRDSGASGAAAVA